MSVLDEPLSRSLDPRTAKTLADNLGLRTVEHLLRHYPRRYIQQGEVSDFSSLREGDYVTVVAHVSSIEFKPMRQRSGMIASVIITDGTGQLPLAFFVKDERSKMFHYLKRHLRPGVRAMFAGEVSRFGQRLQLSHPQFEVLADDGDDDGAAAALSAAFVPVYPATRKATSWMVYRSVLLLVSSVLPMLDDADDPIPEALRERLGLLPLAEALRAVHLPDDRAQIERAQERLRFEEAFVLQAVLAQRRREMRAVPAIPRRGFEDRLLGSFDARLPFELTAGQRQVGADIAADLSQEVPMNRLLQGDVGSGKTLVALRAMLAAVDAGGQAALLAPTEVLAAQHFRTITAMLGDLAQGGMLGGAAHGTTVAMLTGSMGIPARRKAMLDIVSGDAGIVIGTHALLEEPVEFHDLALVVIDEQHRFGVEQRAALAGKGREGTRPHVLVMTATPIPRTVAMTVFGDLDISTLDELPAGRQPISTHVVPSMEKPAYLARAWERVRDAVAAGHQAYVVCPRIGDDAGGRDEDAVDESPADGSGQRPALAVVDVAERLAARDLKGLRLGVLHGRLSADEKDDVMRRFIAGPASPDGIDVLIATTVIEVGVDVPNATVMVILDADRFGMSQLHQLRGRIGRGGHAGLCLLVTEAPSGSPQRERLDAVASTTDGFELSRLDLQMRREGDVLGASQSGRSSSLRLLEVTRHEDVVLEARTASTDVVESDPSLARHPGLVRAIAAIDARADYLEKS